MNKENFSYPLDEGWSTKDIIKVTDLYSAIAQANEKGIEQVKLIAAYKAFKTVVPMKFEEKQIDRAFMQASGYSIYQTLKLAYESKAKIIKINKF
ncbi:UPF0223 family protein [Periweissella beninensis]|uniref:UPF0223 family protein n=1 Tax=Periweissella beninensis TaxID=504936 RepID=A0ABT0VIY5_9LACO|nr:UPF0223 family protein [Periweissella beninensis]MBM7544294.1 uncharacterized protein YktA (UPF0223 family) [Periweissella beninensis]MCM2437796.1 UPF0223 family protein [Periweissella beninensis]MCT4396961.1 UPF0223 family protein [Periweissella beninensis]